MTRPINAFSIKDYEKLTRNPYQAAEFARKAGSKDKTKRKKRGALATAGMVAGGIAGAGTLGYGGSVLARTLKNREPGMGNTGLGASAKRVIARDLERIKSAPGKARTAAGKAFYASAGSAGRAAEAFKSGKGLGKLSDVWKSGKVGKAGLIAGGLAAAGGLGAAGYGAYRAMNKKKKK